jgi:hypothetical protein
MRVALLDTDREVTAEDWTTTETGVDEASIGSFLQLDPDHVCVVDVPTGHVRIRVNPDFAGGGWLHTFENDPGDPEVVHGTIGEALRSSLTWY